MIKKFVIALAIGSALLVQQSALAQAAPAESIDQVKATVLNLIRALVDQGVLSAAKAQDMLRDAGLDPALLNSPQVSRTAPPAAEPPPVVRVPYVPQTVKDEIREEVRKDVLAQAHTERWGDPGSLPDWISRFTLFGDMRIRYQREQYPGDNSAPQVVDAWYQLPPGTTKDTLDSREQEVVRARVGFEAQMGGDFVAQMRIVAVNGDTLTASPVTYNVDEASYGRPFSAGIDLANIQWRPVPAFQATFGRMLKPYLGTDLIYANDLSFDGIVVQARPQFSPAWSAFLTLGMHPLTSNWIGPYNGASNMWLYAGQAGTRWRAQDESTLEVAAAYYDFVGLNGELNPANPPQNVLYADSAAPFRILGNTMFNVNWYSDPNGTPNYAYASKFRLADVFAHYDLARFDPLRISLSAELERNLGFSPKEIYDRIQGAALGLPQDSQGLTALQRPRTTAYRVGFSVGKGAMKSLGDWEIFGGYRYLERDSVPDSFTSLDYNLGGTDQKATILGVNTSLSSRTGLRVFLTSAHSLDAPIKHDTDTLFIDLYGSF
jgi:hypothetical protein